MQEQNKIFIKNNTNLLDKQTKIIIVNLIVNELEDNEALLKGVLKEGKQNEIHIDLDALERINPSIILSIYNIVCARRDSLNRPCKKY
jgi:hypothetical protein